MAKGFTQKEVVDCNEIYSPVMKQRSNRIILTVVAQFDLELEQLDAKIHFFMDNWMNRSLCSNQRVCYRRCWNKSVFAEKILIWTEAVALMIECIFTLY